MKKILYVCKFPLHINTSLKKKYMGQLQGFRNLGMNAYYLAYDEKYYYLIHNEEKIKLRRIYGSRTKLYLHSMAFIDMYLSAKKAMDILDFDYLYVRNDPIEYIGISMYRKAKRKGIYVISELPTYPNSRDNIKNGVYKLILHIVDALGDKTAKYTDLYAVIGEECREYLGKPAINISNAVDVKQFALRTPKLGDSIVVLAVASMSAWHGFDRLIRGIAAYTGTDRICVKLVGNEGDGSCQRWKELAKQLGVEDIVEFYDGRYGEELNEMMNQSDIAVSSIAWYRSKIQSGSPLKNREYMARGIPFVYSVPDDTLHAGLDFVLRIEDNESPVNFEQICKFAADCRKDQSMPVRMRQFAQAHMSWDAQLIKLFDISKP